MLHDSSASPLLDSIPADVALFWDEILSQPCCWKDLVDFYTNSPPALLTFTPKRVVCFAEGSSQHALRLAEPALQQAFQCPIHYIHPYSVVHRTYLEPDGDTLWITASQSGETGCVLEAINALAAHAQHPITLYAFTNKPQSTLAQHSAITQALPVLAGIEQSIPATKSVSCATLSVWLWALHQSQQPNTLVTQALSELTTWLQTQPFHSPEFQLKVFGKTSTPFSKPTLLLGPSHFKALLDEWALKWMETQSQPVLVFDCESFHHGPRALLANKASFNVFIVGNSIHNPGLSITLQWVSQFFKQYPHHPHLFFFIDLSAQHSLSTLVPEFLAQHSSFQSFFFPSEDSNLLKRIFMGLLLAQGLTALALQNDHQPVNHPLLQKFLPISTKPAL